MIERTVEISPIGENTVVRHPMSRQEATACSQAIRNHLETARNLILELYDRQGWRALGYGSWRECVVAEFEQSKSHLYRQLDAAYIEREISPIGEIGSIPESHLRPLGSLPEGERKPAWDRAVATAPDGKLTAKHVQSVVDEVAPPKPKPPRQAPTAPPVVASPPVLDREAIDAGIEAVASEPDDIAAQRRKGIIPDGVAVEVIDTRDPANEEDEPPDVMGEMTDEEYLAKCPAREQLSPYCRTIFDRDALLFRGLDEIRGKFIHHATRAIAANRKRGKTGRYHASLSSFVRRKHPKHWLVCADCKGTARIELIGGCPTCKETGYHA